MKSKTYYTVPGTDNVLRPLVRPRCGHGEDVPRWTLDEECTPCYMAKHYKVIV